MRLLITSTWGTGHLDPLLPFAIAAKESGHDVALATTDDHRGRIEGLGLPFYRSGVGKDHEAFQSLARSGALQRDDAMGALLVSSMAPYALSDLYGIFDDFKPNLVFSDAVEFAGQILAHKQGVKKAIFCFTGTYNQEDFVRRIRHHLTGFCATAGVSGDVVSAIVQSPQVICAPPSLSPPGSIANESTFFCKPNNYDLTGQDTPPRWIKSLKGQQTCYVTLGGKSDSPDGLLEVLLDGVEGQAEKVIVTSPRLDPAKIKPLPSNFIVQSYVPRSWLFPNVDYIVGKSSHTLVSAALRYGIPMVLIPILGEDSYNAEACVRLGVAEVVPLNQVTAERVRDALCRVKTNGSYLSNARKIAREIDQLPTTMDAIAFLEKVSASG